MGETQAREQQVEVDKNYKEFLKLLPSIIGQHRNKFALMQNGEVVGYYSTSLDARMTAEKFLQGKLFSIQKVTDTKADLGFFSHALHQRVI